MKVYTQLNFGVRSFSFSAHVRWCEHGAPIRVLSGPWLVIKRQVSPLRSG